MTSSDVGQRGGGEPGSRGVAGLRHPPSGGEMDGQPAGLGSAQLLIGLMSVLAGGWAMVLLVVSKPVSVKITVYAP